MSDDYILANIARIAAMAEEAERAEKQISVSDSYAYSPQVTEKVTGKVAEIIANTEKLAVQEIDKKESIFTEREQREKESLAAQDQFAQLLKATMDRQTEATVGTYAFDRTNNSIPVIDII